MKMVAIMPALLTISACGSPKDMAEVSPEIVSAGIVDGTYQVDGVVALDTREPYLEQAAPLVRAVGKAVQRGVPGPNADDTFIQIKVSWATIDRLGNDSSTHFATFAFLQDDFRNANFDRLRGIDALAVANLITAGESFEAASDFCDNRMNRRQYLGFCINVELAEEQQLVGILSAEGLPTRSSVDEMVDAAARAADEAIKAMEEVG